MINLRRAVPADAASVASVYIRSFNAALPTVRRGKTDDEIRDYIARVVVPDRETWVADEDGILIGLMVLNAGWISQLYLLPDARGRGLGDRFVTLAKERFTDGLQLWAFQVNEPALRFYARHGFEEAERTDGSENQEKEPDVRMEWLP